MNKVLYILSFLLLIHPFLGLGELEASNCCSSNSIEQSKDVSSKMCHVSDVNSEEKDNNDEKDNKKGCCSDMCSGSCCYSPIIVTIEFIKTNIEVINDRTRFIHFDNYNFSFDRNTYHPPKLV